MTDKLYLLTEAELRAMLAEAYHCEDCAGPDTDYAYGYAGNVIDRLTPLAPDWSKAPEWATWAFVGMVYVTSDFDPNMEDDKVPIGALEERPAKGDGNGA